MTAANFSGPGHLLMLIKWRIRIALLVLSGLFSAGSSFAVEQSAADMIIGVWLTQDQDAKIEIYRSGNAYDGKIVWLKEPREPRSGEQYTDTGNPDYSKRNRPLLGLILVKGLEHSGNKTWTDATVYDPSDGKYWRCKAYLENIRTLKFTGFWGISVFGRTETWTRSTQ